MDNRCARRNLCSCDACVAIFKSQEEATQASQLQSNMPQETKAHPFDAEDSENVGFAHENLEGWIPTVATDEELRVALEKAFDYRGDVTLTLKDGRRVEGYIFDRTG